MNWELGIILTVGGKDAYCIIQQFARDEWRDCRGSLQPHCQWCGSNRARSTSNILQNNTYLIFCIFTFLQFYNSTILHFHKASSRCILCIMSYFSNRCISLAFYRQWQRNEMEIKSIKFISIQSINWCSILSGTNSTFSLSVWMWLISIWWRENTCNY